MDYKTIPVVAIVILNWNGQKFLAKFLPSVLENSTGCTIYVVDNNSTDNSVSYLKDYFPAVKLIIHSQNLGFCEGYNQALNHIQADYYVLLNSDVEVTPNWVSPLLALMENDQNIAACQPKIKSYHQPNYFEYAGAGGGLMDKFGYPFCRGRIFNHLEEDKGQYNDTTSIFWATGACMFVRAEAFKEAGGLEPAFFAHMEEIDLCWRLQNQNYKIMYCGASEVYHVGGGTLPKTNPHKTYLNFRNGLAMVYKNLPHQNFNFRFFARIILDWVAAIQFLVTGNSASFRAVIKAHGAVWQNRKYWRQKRKYQAPVLNNNVSGLLNGSIIWNYFILKKKLYPEIKHNLSNISSR